jgi:type IV pilus assembly protein PilO
MLYLGVGAVIYMVYFNSLLPFSYKTRAREMGVLRGEMQKLESDVRIARQSLDQKGRLQQLYNSTHDSYLAARELLPERNLSSEMLRKLVVLAQEADVRVIRFRPGVETPHEGYFEFPLELTVTGSYHGLGLFLAKVSNCTRIVRVGSVKMDALSDQEPEKTVEGQLTLLTYAERGEAHEERVPAG